MRFSQRLLGSLCAIVEIPKEVAPVKKTLETSFTLTWGTGTPGLGCHLGSISNFALGGASVAVSPYTYLLLGGVNTPISKVVTDEGKVLGGEDYAKIKEWAQKLVVSLRFQDFLYSEVVALYNENAVAGTNYDMWVMSGPCNYAFGNTKIGLNLGGEIKATYSVSGFAAWLRKNKVGHITASAIGTNHLHLGSPTDISLNRVWTWIPPRSVVRGIRDSEWSSTPDNMPNAEGLQKWLLEQRKVQLPCPYPELLTA